MSNFDFFKILPYVFLLLLFLFRSEKWSSCRFTYSYLVTTFASSIEEISVNFQTSETPIYPITCIAPSSETTTGGVYKWQGRNRHSLMSYAYEIFLVTRPIIAILGPNWVDVIPVFPRPCGQAGPTKRRSSCSHWHCSARVAQSIEEHHRPAVAQNFT